MTGEVLHIVGHQRGEATIGVLRPSGRVTIELDSDHLTFEESEQVDVFIGWLQEAKRLAERLALEEVPR